MYINNSLDTFTHGTLYNQFTHLLKKGCKYKQLNAIFGDSCWYDGSERCKKIHNQRLQVMLICLDIYFNK